MNRFSLSSKVSSVLSVGLCGVALWAAPFFVSAESIGPITFEPVTYVAGGIHGQDGWVKTGAFDVAVTTNTGSAPVSFGTQSLRLSDAVTSGSFGDQTFSKSLVNEAGETDALSDGMSGGVRQPHFEAQFDFASILPTEQSGMHVSVSPDRGDGARMSYLRFEDTTAGIDVFFDDVQGTVPLGTDGCTTIVCGNFVETKIATITRAAHTIKFSMDFVDGPSNDIVKIYIDGNLIHVGTSWEDYYRFDPESNPSLISHSRTVDSLLFRESGGANPDNSGNGFLVDNLSLMSGSVVAPATNTVVVHPVDMATNIGDVITTPTKWFFYNDETDAIDNTLGSFVTGPAVAPLGTGSAQISVSGTQRRNLSTYQFSGTKLGDINQLKFSTYNPSAGNGGSTNRSAYLNFNVDFNGSDAWQARLVFVPNENATVTQDNWKEWDAYQGGNAKWTYSRASWPNTMTGPHAGLVSDPSSNLRTWNDLLADYPGIRVRVSDSWLGLRVGEPYSDGYTENLDKFVFGTNSSVTTFDFDPTPAPTSATVHIFKYIDGAQATVVSANSVNFPMFTSTYNAPFTLGPAGWTVGDIAYEASTSAMPIGASYSAEENLTTTLVSGGTSCDGIHPYRLDGYSVGDTLSAAQGATPTLTIPSFTNLQGDKYIIVRNVTCEVTPPTFLKVHILKYLDGQVATALASGNYQFPMTATWSAVNIGAGTGNYVLGNNHGGAVDQYGADTASMQAPADYTTSEITNGTSNVLPIGGACVSGKFQLVGYKKSSVSFADAISSGVLLTSAPVFAGLTSDQYVVVLNKKCPTAGTISGMKYNDLNRNGKKDVGEPGLAGWTIKLEKKDGTVITSAVTVSGGAYSFANLAPGTYKIREVHQNGWKRMSKNPKPIIITAGSVVTGVNFGNAQKHKPEREDNDNDDQRDED